MKKIPFCAAISLRWAISGSKRKRKERNQITQSALKACFADSVDRSEARTSDTNPCTVIARQVRAELLMLLLSFSA